MIKLYNEKEHYETLKQWWLDHNWLPLDKEILPKTGLIV